MKRLRVRERSFKRISFGSTLLGILLIAIGLQQGLVAGRWLVTAALCFLGAATALITVLLEIVPEAGFVVTLYTREGCSLCDAARAFLMGKKGEYDYDLWEVDVDKVPQNLGGKAGPAGSDGVDADPASAKYSDFVPVATVGKEELFRLAPDYPRLEARLRALADARVRR